MSALAQEIERLGGHFAGQVAGTELSPPAFAARAAEVIEDLLAGGWGLEALVEMVRSGLPRQERVNPNFGQPAITLFLHEDFRIDALCWRPGATSIHHHDFSGAFGVLSGTSLQRTLSFTGARSSGSASVEILDGFSEEVAVLRQGEVRTIQEGPGFAHQVTHVEPAAVTLVLRSHGPLAGAEEWSYLPPSLRVASRDQHAETDQQARFYRFLRDLQPERAVGFASAVIAGGDDYAAVEMLRVLAQGDRDFETTRRLAQERSVAPEVVESLVHEASRERLAAAMKRARTSVARAVFGVFSTATRFDDRRRLLEELSVVDAEIVASRVLGEWLVRLGLDPAERDPFERDLAEHFATVRDPGAAAPPTSVAEPLDRLGLGPCILGRIPWPELERRHDVPAMSRQH